jgi:hypothetical protein
MKLASIPYKIICVALVGTAIVMGAVLAVGIPANLIYLFN